MWARRLAQPGLFETIEVAAPRSEDLAPGQVLLRTLAGGVCGSDLPRFRGHKAAITDARGVIQPSLPGFPMHEVAGEVVASRHSQVRPGTRVVGWATAYTAIAEYCVTDGDELNVYDPALKPLEGVLIQSVTCVLYALDRVDLAGKHVAVVGLGPIGATFAHVAKQRGARRVTGVDPIDRSGLSPVLGVDETLLTTSRLWAGAIADGDRPDVVIEAVGHQIGTLNDAIEATAPEGAIVYFGVPDDPAYPVLVERMLRKNLSLQAGTTRERRKFLAAGDRYVGEHPDLYDALVTHVFAPDTVQDAFEAAIRPAAGQLKILLELA